MTTSSNRIHESIINYVSARLLREQTKLPAVAETPYDGNRAGVSSSLAATLSP